MTDQKSRYQKRKPLSYAKTERLDEEVDNLECEQAPEVISYRFGTGGYSNDMLLVSQKEERNTKTEYVIAKYQNSPESSLEELSKRNKQM